MSKCNDFESFRRAWDRHWTRSASNIFARVSAVKKKQKLVWTYILAEGMHSKYSLSQARPDNALVLSHIVFCLLLVSCLTSCKIRSFLSISAWNSSEIISICWTFQKLSTDLNVQELQWHYLAQFQICPLYHKYRSGRKDRRRCLTPWTCHNHILTVSAESWTQLEKCILTFFGKIWTHLKPKFFDLLIWGLNFFGEFWHNVILNKVNKNIIWNSIMSREQMTCEGGFVPPYVAICFQAVLRAPPDIKMGTIMREGMFSWMSLVRRVALMALVEY